MSDTAPIILVSPDMRPSVMGVARSLAEVELLQRFVTTVAVGNGSDPALLSYLPDQIRRAVRSKLSGRTIPEFMDVPVETFPTREMVNLIGRRAGVGDIAAHRLWEWSETSFDKQVAARWAGRAPVIYGCEHASVETFAQQKVRKGFNILWQVTAHHSFVLNVLREEYEKYPEALTPYQRHIFKVISPINSRKDQQYSDADLIVTNSEFSRSTFVATGIPKNKVVAVPTGCPVPQTKRTFRVKSNGDKMVFLHAGNLSIQKGTPYLLTAWRKCATENSELLMIGTNLLPPGLIAGPFRNLRILPRVSRSELTKQFEQASVLVLPTLAEGMAHIILEAMAAGLAIVTTENSGCGTLVEDGINGWKVPIREPETLAARLAWCIKNPELVLEMQKQSLKKAQAWQVKDFARKHSEVIGGFLKGNGITLGRTYAA
jgi:glycosyltransferase involved in cell wall biosynthesis